MPSASDISIVELTATSPADLIAGARALLHEYGDFLAAEPSASHVCMSSLRQEAEQLPASYIEQGGGCLIAQVNNQPSGFVAWRRAPDTLAATAWEIKRLWVRPAARGLGLGRSLAQQVLDRAAAAHRTAVYLDTIPAAMPAAHRLYLDMGFIPCEPYNGPRLEQLDWLVKFL